MKLVAAVAAQLGQLVRRIQAEDKLREYSEHLEELVEERTEKLRTAERLAGVGQATLWVGHDLRNPLQVVMNTLYEAKRVAADPTEGVPRPATKRFSDLCSVMAEQVAYMNKIVSDLHDYASPLGEVELAEVDTRQFLGGVVSAISIPGSIETSIEIDNGARKMSVDPQMMRRAFTNLILNAIQAMPNGGKLTISVSRVEGEAKACVCDTGSGIPEEAKGRLFEPFFTTKAKGQGLGLPVCKKIVEAHNGAIAVTSEAGKGTTVSFTIPQK